MRTIPSVLGKRLLSHHKAEEEAQKKERLRADEGYLDSMLGSVGCALESCNAMAVPLSHYLPLFI